MTVPKLSRVRYEGRVGGINLILNAQMNEYMDLVIRVWAAKPNINKKTSPVNVSSLFLIELPW
jgi:hypothetical protein